MGWYQSWGLVWAVVGNTNQQFVVFFLRQASSASAARKSMLAELKQMYFEPEYSEHRVAEAEVVQDSILQDICQRTDVTWYQGFMMVAVDDAVVLQTLIPNWVGPGSPTIEYPLLYGSSSWEKGKAEMVADAAKKCRTMKYRVIDFVVDPIPTEILASIRGEKEVLNALTHRNRPNQQRTRNEGGVQSSIWFTQRGV
jgi:hypothetical protein